MVGEGLFAAEGRPSPGQGCYLETHRNMTPSKTVRPNANPGVTEDMRRMDFFDDPVTFVRELSTVSLGVPEFSKFEKNVYKSRYLNTPECVALLHSHYNNLMTRYAPRLVPLLSQYRADVTLSTLNQLSLFSSDHLKSLTVLVVLGNYHNLNMEGLSGYLLNTMKLVYRAVTSSKVDPVEKSRVFYSFLTKSEGVGRVVVLYMLLLAALEKVLWFAEGDVGDDDMYPVFAFVICCFVEEMLNGEMAEYPPQKMGLVPPMSSRMDMLVRHFSVVTFLLKLKVALPNATVLLSCARAFRSKLRTSSRNRSLLVWAGLINVYLDPDEVSSGAFKAPRAFFDEVGVNNNLMQFTHVVACLQNCFKDLSFCKYVEDNLSITKFVSLFLFNVWKYINNLKEDLANEILLLANTMLDTFPKTLAALAKFLAQFTYREKGEGLGINAGRENDSKLSVGVQKSLETLFNIALLGKSRLQMSACLFVAKLLISADVTVTLPRVNKLSYTNLMLTDLGLTNPTAYMANYNKEYNVETYSGEYTNGYLGEARRSDPLQDDNLVKDLAKTTVLASLMKFCWKDVLSCLLAKLGPYMFEYQKNNEKFGAPEKQPEKYFKLDQFDGYKGDQYGEKMYDKYKGDPMERNGAKPGKDDKGFDRDLLGVLNYVKNAHLGSASKETLYSMLSSGNLPAKMLSYETLLGLTPTPDTLVMCAMVGLYGRYQAFTTLFNNYLSMKGSYAYSTSALYNRNLTNSMVLLLDNLVTQYVEGCDITRQKLVNSLLVGTKTSSDADKERYNQMAKSVKEYKSELHRLRGDYDQLMSELGSKREEYECTLSKLKAELTSTSDRHKNELHKMKEMVMKSNASLQHMEQAVSSAKAENTTLKQENSRVVSERDNLKSEMSMVRTKMTQQQGELDRLSNMMRDYEAKSARLKKLQADNDRMAEEMAQYNSNLDNVYRMLICLADKYKTNVEVLESQKERFNNLTHQLTQQKMTVDRLESDLKDKQHLVSELNNWKSSNEAELARMRDELMRREDSLASANRKLKEFRERVDQLSLTVKSKTEMFNSLSRQYDETQRELAQRRQQLTAIESAFNQKPL